MIEVARDHPDHLLIVADSRAGEESAITAVDHAVIGGVVAVVVFAMLCLLIILGRYFARHKGQCKGSACGQRWDQGRGDLGHPLSSPCLFYGLGGGSYFQLLPHFSAHPRKLFPGLDRSPCSQKQKVVGGPPSQDL